jgi:hypothetical protein
MGAVMSQRDHKMISTPVSVQDGFRRADGRTWSVLLIGAVIAIAIVVLIDLFVEKPKVRWPTSPTQAPPAAQPSSDEPRTYDVAPPGAVPPKD